jgi:hypothetical protein
MKIAFILSSLAIALLVSSFTIGNPGPVRKKLKGAWTYSYSIANNERKRIPGDVHCPVYRMVFAACNDSTDMKKISSPVVHKMRKQNVLKDLKCTTYDSVGTKIDTYFPVLNFLRSDSLMLVLDYGYKYKSEYYIDVLSADSMVLHDNRVYDFDGKSCYEVKHVYYRRK